MCLFYNGTYYWSCCRLAGLTLHATFSDETRCMLSTAVMQRHTARWELHAVLGPEVMKQYRTSIDTITGYNTGSPSGTTLLFLRSNTK